MNKNLKIFLILMLLFCLVLSSSCAKANEHGPLVRCATYRGGGMDGGSSRAELSEKDGQTVLVTAVSRYWNAPFRVSEYRADDDALPQLKEIADKYGMAAWHDLPYSELIALDAPSTSYVLVFDDSALNGMPYETVSFSLDQKLPRKGSEGVKALSSCLRQWEKDSRLIDRHWENMDGQELGRIPADADPEAGEALEELMEASMDFRSALMNEGKRFEYEGTQDIDGEACWVFILEGESPERFAIAGSRNVYRSQDGSGNWQREEP